MLFSNLTLKKIVKATSIDEKSFPFSLVLSVIFFFLVVFASDLNLGTTSVSAFQVDPLPSDNLIVNPWFRKTTTTGRKGTITVASHDGWTNVLNNGAGWGTTQKESDPSPDTVIAPACNYQPVFCGTGIRWAKNAAKGAVQEFYPGVDVYIYQVVNSDPGKTKLKFFTHWVAHKIEIAEVVIYGGNDPAGLWQPVWTPFYQSIDYVQSDSDQSETWIYFTSLTPPVEAVISQGYPFYKVEIHARYGDPDPSLATGGVGVKFTGVYFATENAGPTPTPDPNATPTPTASASPTPTASPSPSISPTPTPSNTNPSIRTTTLNSGNVGVSYSSQIQGTDNDDGDVLTMTAQNQPPGTDIGSCSQALVSGQERLTCYLEGIPTQSGTFNVQITLKDDKGGTAQKTLSVTISP